MPCSAFPSHWAGWLQLLQLRPAARRVFLGCVAGLVIHDPGPPGPHQPLHYCLGIWCQPRVSHTVVFDEAPFPEPLALQRLGRGDQG